MSINCFSLELSTFHGREVPREGVIVGYGAIIEAYGLAVPIPPQLAFVSAKKRQSESAEWKTYSSRYFPEETVYKQLTFALKYEGVNLLVFKKLFEAIDSKEWEEMLGQEALGQYSRRIWFLYEWLMHAKLNLADLKTGNLVPLIDEKLQYSIQGVSSPRHKIINNLPGTAAFCPLISRTAKLEAYINDNILSKKENFLDSIHKEVLQRASSFLLLKDSKASFSIAMRWGKAIGQAGQKLLSIDELLRLQQIVIERSRFIAMGLRQKGGFVGEHDRTSGEPIPDHISAKPDDVQPLLDGLMATNEILQDETYDAVLAAATIAFGFVFIHPFVDGNGRLHRYIIHHILAKKQLTQQGVIFPVSSSILDHIADYRKTLEAYSLPLLDHIEWTATKDHNVAVTNETIDLYRYFDATKQAEFLYACVADTLERVIPQEVSYLQHFDAFKKYVDDQYEMPDKLVALLVRFLEQGGGKLSKRSAKKEFSALTEIEIEAIETQFATIFELEK
jgi:Fic family protein